MCVSLSSADGVHPATELTVLIFPQCCCFMIGATALHEYGPEQFHLRHELQEFRIEGAGLGVDGTTATSARIRDQDINPTPFLDDARHHYLDRSAVMDIDLNTDGGAARRLDLHDCAIAAHVLRLGLEFFIRAQIHIGDRDLGPQPGEPLRVGTSETPCCTRYDRNLSGDAIRRSLMPRSVRADSSDGRPPLPMRQEEVWSGKGSLRPRVG